MKVITEERLKEIELRIFETGNSSNEAGYQCLFTNQN